MRQPDRDALNVAVIGCGMIAREAHLPSLCSFDDVRIVAACDRSPDALREVENAFGVLKTYSDYHQMLRAEHPDCVYVLTPPQQTFDAAVASLEAGADIFLEKPPGVTVGQAMGITRLAKSTDHVAMVGFNRRFIPWLVETKRQVEQAGRIRHCVAIYNKRLLNQPPYFHGAVDFLTSDVIHAVDALRWMCGEAVSVASHIHTSRAGYATGFDALLEFGDGVVGHLCASWTAGGRTHVFYMDADDVSGIVDISDLGPASRATVQREGATSAVRIPEMEGKSKWHEVYGFDQENRHFLDCVRSRCQPLTAVEDSVRTMELVDWIYHAQTVDRPRPGVSRGSRP